MIVAIDGTVASGKSSAARMLAAKLGWLYINTGLMYRGVAAFARSAGILTTDRARLAACAESLKIDLRNAPDGQHVFVNGADLTRVATAPDIGPDVSNVADNEGVRHVLVREQRRLGVEAGDAVLDGRDIGSVVFPDAQVKFFVTAELAERARRRLADDMKSNPSLTIGEVEQSVAARDERDRTRPVGALKRMPGSIEIDTTRNSGPEETVKQMLSRIEEVRGPKSEVRDPKSEARNNT